ncbi:calcium-binding protein [Burkholderia ubonensis]|uniref:calcium-binding protein n=1 Tax=Burkholderia ubonensis TaxID=101571 RepID=UPI000A6F0D24|nr:calcium-binding protein [Burkholderia ubonensis]
MTTIKSSANSASHTYHNGNIDGDLNKNKSTSQSKFPQNTNGAASTAGKNNDILSTQSQLENRNSRDSNNRTDQQSSSSGDSGSSSESTAQGNAEKQSKNPDESSKSEGQLSFDGSGARIKYDPNSRFGQDIQSQVRRVDDANQVLSNDKDFSARIKQSQEQIVTYRVDTKGGAIYGVDGDGRDVAELYRRDAVNSQSMPWKEKAEQALSEKKALEDRFGVDLDGTAPLATGHRYYYRNKPASAKATYGTDIANIEDRDTASQQYSLSANRTKRNVKDESGASSNVENAKSAQLNDPISMDPNPNLSEPEKLQALTALQERFQAQDHQFGMLKIGNFGASREMLVNMGATIHGRLIRPDDTNKATIDPSLIEYLQFDGKKIDALPADKKDIVSDILFELATIRKQNGLSVIAPSFPASKTEILLKNLLDEQQCISKDIYRQPENAPKWADETAHRVNIGLRTLSLYSSVKGLFSGIKKEDAKEIATESLALLADIGPEIGETVIKGLSHHATQRAGLLWGKFKQTSATKLIKTVNVAGNTLSAGVDLYQGVNSVIEALNAKDPEVAKQHWISAGFSAANIGVTIAATGLYFASPAIAAIGGPITFVAGVGLFIGQQVYAGIQAGERVREVNEVTSLDGLDKFRVWIVSFFGDSLPESIATRYYPDLEKKKYFTSREKSARTLLDGVSGKTTEAIVQGSVNIELIQRAKRRERLYSWGEKSAVITETIGTKVTNTGNDNIDAADGLNAKFVNQNNLKVAEGESGDNKSIRFEDGTQIIYGTQGDDKAVRFETGGGNDRIRGVKTKPNHFFVGQGEKDFAGGDKDDHFYVYSPTDNASGGKLSGGGGSDRLILDNSEDTDSTIDLRSEKSGEGILTFRNTKNSSESSVYTLDSFERVVTGEKGTTRVYGSDGREMITARGRSIIDAGAGDDQILIGSTASGEFSGGKGQDTYVIESGAGSVTLKDDPSEDKTKDDASKGRKDSVVFLKMNSNDIENFRVEGMSAIIETRTSDGNPGRTITLTNVYQEKDGKRMLHNGRWTIVTDDGHYLKINLPPSLPIDDSSIDLKVQVFDSRKPFIQNRVSYNLDGAKGKTTIDLEYGSADIESVHAYYSLPNDPPSQVGSSIHEVSENLKEAARKRASIIIKFKDGRELELSGIPLGNLRPVYVKTKDGKHYRVSTPALDKDSKGPKPLTVDGSKYFIEEGALVLAGSNSRATRYVPFIRTGQEIEAHPGEIVELRSSEPAHEIKLKNGGRVRLMPSNSSSGWVINIGSVGYRPGEIQLIDEKTLKIGGKTFIYDPIGKFKNVKLINSQGITIDFSA